MNQMVIMSSHDDAPDTGTTTLLTHSVGLHLSASEDHYLGVTPVAILGERHYKLYRSHYKSPFRFYSE